MSEYEIVKKNQFHKKTGKKKSKVTMFNLTNLLLGIWDHDNLAQKKKQQTMKLNV
jgi:hypothetical protein